MGRECGVIFDVDGVLVDSYAAHFASWQVAARQYGFEFTERIFIETFGRTTREILREACGGAVVADQVAEIDARKEEAFREILAADFPGMDGASDLIRQLSAEGFRLAVGSSGPPENVELVLRLLGCRSCFSAAVTGTDVTQGKPHPQVFLLAAQRLGLPPERCVVIEDAPAGIEAARRAGMPCVGFASRGHTLEELRRATLRVESLRELSPATIQTLVDGSARGNTKGLSPMARRLYVGNLPWSVTSTELQSLFAEHGEVASAEVISDRVTGRSRGFGFVQMESDDGASAAIEALHGKEVNGRALVVNEAQERPQSGGWGESRSRGAS